jgi:hypothetical protein
MRLTNYEKMALGEEPLFTEAIRSVKDSRLLHAYNWYSHFFDPDKSLRWVKEYMKEEDYDEEYIKGLTRTPPNHISAIARMLMRGNELPEELVEKLHDYIDKEIETPEKTPERELPKVLLRTKAKIGETIGRLENVLDDFYNNNYVKTSPNVVELLREQDIKASQVQPIIDYYRPLWEELMAARDNNEGFERLTEKQLDDYCLLVFEIIGDLQKYSSDEKKLRRPRKKKVQDSGKLIRNVKYMRQFAELGLVSDNPINIIGSTSVWLYNTKYKRLTNLVTNGNLSVKGTTIINFDEKLSTVKTLRKPKETLNKVLTGTKVSLRKIFDDLTTKDGIPNGRLNEETIILRVLK